MRKILGLWALFSLALALPILVARSAGEALQAEPASTALQRPFDPDAATEALLASQATEVRARSDAYFEGSCWTAAIGELLEVAVMGLLLFVGWSAAMRDRAERLTRFQSVRTLLYAWQLFLVWWLLMFPWSVYDGFLRERSYGFLTEDSGFGAWLRGRLIGLVMGTLLLGVLFVIVYGIIRRAPRTWWRWGAGVVVLGVLMTLGVRPVLAGLFSNSLTKLDSPAVRDSVLRLARANGIDADKSMWSPVTPRGSRPECKGSGARDASW